MTAVRVAGALFVDLGEGREDRRTGHIRWSRPPRARYECLRCGTTEGPVTGAAAVARFVATIRTTHPTRCTTTHEGTRAA
ncbi:hypothetical protein AB0B79_25760 [Streptomyces sp. NPDC039022]|uniref:hypothetical protein n=1 Tax=Streptomyces sp. NPDC039022 TaxID=3157091 RepID=UPI00340FFD3F